MYELGPPYYDGLQDEAGRPVELEPLTQKQIEQLRTSYRNLIMAALRYEREQRKPGFFGRFWNYLTGK
jgi:hypothetical protein